MIIRRAMRYWMFIAAPILPIWPLIGWAVFGGSGWAFFGLAVAMPILFVALLIAAFLIYARPQVREDQAVSWLDVGLLVLWQASIVAFGFFGPAASLFAVLGVLIALATFWASIAQFVRDAAARTRATFAEFERQAQAPTASRPRPTVNGGEFIVIEEGKNTPN